MEAGLKACTATELLRPGRARIEVDDRLRWSCRNHRTQIRLARRFVAAVARFERRAVRGRERLRVLLLNRFGHRLEGARVDPLEDRDEVHVLPVGPFSNGPQTDRPEDVLA